MKVEIKELPIGKIRTNPKNPRFIKDDKYKSLLKSLKDFPEMKSIREIVIDEDYIILGGNMRYKAIKELGEKTAQVKIVSGLTEKQKQEFIVKDNQPYGSWDMDLLANDFELNDLLEWGFDEADLDIDKFKDPIDEEKLDEVPEPQKDAISKLGDLFVIDGKHRVLCGDSTKEADVGTLMGGIKADMVFTDPPYNVAFNGRSGNFEVIKNDDLGKTEFLGFIAKFIGILKMVNPKTYYVCCNWKFYDILMTELKFMACIVWAKNVFGLGRGYRHQHEFILFNGFIKADITNESDLWEIKKDSKYKHPTQKPVQLPMRAINNSSFDGDAILDLFLGSGSTLIASEQTNRICYGMELDPIYIDVILRRYKNLYPNAKIECLNRKFNFEELWQKEADLKS